MGLRQFVTLTLVTFALLAHTLVIEALTTSDDLVLPLHLKYSGLLVLSTSGNYVSEVFGDLAEWCETSPGEAHIILKYTVELHVEFNARIGFTNINAVKFDFNSTEVLISSPFCLAEATRNILQGVSTVNASFFSLVLRLKRGAGELEPINESGVVVAVTRYGGIDIVQVKDEFTVYSTIHGVFSYSRNLYYEPLSRIPIHYTEVNDMRDEKGTLLSILYVTLDIPNLNYADLFNNIITRRTFDIFITAVDNRQVTYKATLIISYVESSADRVNIAVSVVNNTIIIAADPPTRCFIVLGLLRDNVVNTSLELNYYIVKSALGDGFVYYTSSPQLCNNEWIQLPSIVVEQRYQVEVPEKLPPPSKPIEKGLVDYAVGGFTLVLTLILAYYLCKHLVRRILR
ncbi:MAG: hypothetical protein QW205_01460 [Desulfurococcaceae archaeon]